MKPQEGLKATAIDACVKGNMTVKVAGMHNNSILTSQLWFF